MLQNLTDEHLIAKTERLVREERKILTSLLHHLREIERRRLFSSLGYTSLFDMVVRHFGYSSDQAFRRISAMRLMKELPEVEAKLNSGELTLTHIGLAQSLFKAEKKIRHKELAHETKLSVLDRISNTSVREAEKITLSFATNPTVQRPDRINVVSDEHIELKFLAASGLRDKIEMLKGMLAHKHPDISLGDLIDRLCDLGLEEWDQTKTVSEKRQSKINLSVQGPNGTSVNQQVPALSKGKQESLSNSPPLSKAAVLRQVFGASGNKCENCQSTYALEVDHIIPRAKGGTNHRSNLRVLCRNCNQRAAIVHFGIKKMESFLNGKITMGTTYDKDGLAKEVVQRNVTLDDQRGIVRRKYKFEMVRTN